MYTYTKYLLIDVINKVSGQHLAIKFWGSQKFYVDFRLYGGLAPLTPSVSRVNHVIHFVFTNVILTLV